MGLVFKSVLALCVYCRAVYHRGKKDQDDDFTVQYNIDMT